MIRPARVIHLGILEAGRLIERDRPALLGARVDQRHVAVSAVEAYQNSGPLAVVMAVQQPSPSRSHALFGSSAIPALGHGKSPAAKRPSADTWNVSPLTGVLFQTSSDFRDRRSENGRRWRSRSSCCRCRRRPTRCCRWDSARPRARSPGRASSVPSRPVDDEDVGTGALRAGRARACRQREQRLHVALPGAEDDPLSPLPSSVSSPISTS